MYNISESSKSCMQRFEEPHTAQQFEPQFVHPCQMVLFDHNNLKINLSAQDHM